jgi:peptidoglycan/LPS O-acetylase OafA/YrhL
MSNLKYRPDIDGLRALAVLTVIAFHFDSRWISGGFIGVDVFFVISGYIITTAIYPEILSGRFSFAEFYAKRIKRILPLFYLVVAVCLVITYLLYTPSDFMDFADSLRYSSSFISNIYFERLSGYFAPTSETMPLLHTWSLSIEEQFYFIWPILLILCTKFLSKKVFVTGLVSLLIVLSCYSEYLALNNTSEAYYFIQSRGFELLLGALLAVVLFLKRETSISFTALTYQLCGILGLSLLLVLFFYIDKNSVFPGFNAALVAIASSLIILSGEHRKGLVYTILSNSVFVFVGKLSYSLYLWHWPVLAIYRYYNVDFNIQSTLICIVTTIILSILSWRFFETPLRHKVMKKRWIYLLYFVIPVILSITVAKVIVKNDGYGERFSDEALRLYNISKYSYDDEKLNLPQTNAYKPFEPYLIGNATLSTKSEIKTFVWGDSHAGHFRSFVSDLGEKYHFSSLFGGLGGCPPLLGADLIKNGKPETSCTERNNELAKLIIDSDATVVFLAGRWAMYTETTRAEGERGSRVYLGDETDYSENRENSRRAFNESLERTIKLLIDNGKIPVLFNQVPSYSFNPSNCWIKKESYPWLSDVSCNLEQIKMDNRLAYANKVISTLAVKYPSLIVITPTDLLCDGRICKSKLDGIPLYRDNDHLNSEGARSLLRAYLQSDESNRLKALLSSSAIN